MPIANNTLIEVWVQGEKVEGQWQFDDGTPIPDVCPTVMSNEQGKVHIQALGSTSLTCVDAPNAIVCFPTTLKLRIEIETLHL